MTTTRSMSPKGSILFILYFKSLAAAITLPSYSLQCQPHLLTLYVPYNGTVTLECITSCAQCIPTLWTSEIFDSNGTVVKRETLLPANSPLLAYTAPEEGVYVFSSVGRELSFNCQCRFEVKANLSVDVTSSILEDFDLRYGKLNATSHNFDLALHQDLSKSNCSQTLCSFSGKCLAVAATWYVYKDGTLQEPSAEGTLPAPVTPSTKNTITSDGDYFCLTTVNLSNGSSVAYVTATRRVLGRGESSITVSPTPFLMSESSLTQTEVALISVIVVVLLVLVICILMVCCISLMVCRRKGPVFRHSRLHEEEEQFGHNNENQTLREDTSKEDAIQMEVAFNSVVFEELLYKGTFKNVHRALIGSTEVAVKRLRDQASMLGLNELKNEEEILKEIWKHVGGHPNIMPLHHLQIKDCPTCLLLEYASFGTLDRFLNSIKTGFIPEWYMLMIRESSQNSYPSHVAKDLMNVATQVADAMRFLSLRALVHRDLSTRNTFIYNEFIVKIGNFGQQYEGNYYLVTERGHYMQDMAPECMWHQNYSVKSDVWSFGMLMYKLVTLEGVPFPGVEPAYLYREIEDGKRPTRLPCFSKKLFSMMQQCWHFTPSERPDFITLLNVLNDMKQSPSLHIILHSYSDTAALGIPAWHSQHRREGDLGSQRSGSATSSKAEETVHTVGTTESMVMMQSDNEEKEQEEEEEEDDDDDEEEEENEDDTSLGPPDVKKLCIPLSRQTDDRVRNVKRTKNQSDVDISQWTMDVLGINAHENAAVGIPKHKPHATALLTNDGVAYKKLRRSKGSDELDITPMYAELISSLASSGSGYP